jgi:hypothetical protein
MICYHTVELADEEKFPARLTKLHESVGTVFGAGF